MQDKRKEMPDAGFFIHHIESGAPSGASGGASTPARASLVVVDNGAGVSVMPFWRTQTEGNGGSTGTIRVTYLLIMRFPWASSRTFGPARLEKIRIVSLKLFQRAATVGLTQPSSCDTVHAN
jgi:hypothetical protein